MQQEERMRMESRRQATVSWDSGGSDEAPPKVANVPNPTSGWVPLKPAPELCDVDSTSYEEEIEFQVNLRL